MDDTLAARLLTRLQSLCGAPLHGLRLCVAYSGGLDSSVLLHALATLRAEAGFKLSALHVHHGLNPRADAWAQHCLHTCAALAVPCQLSRVDVPRDDPAGLEAAARRVRHAALAAVDADWVVLAHHRGDQAETVLHHIARGSGVYGAAGMAASDPQRRLLRPLLDEPRPALEAHAAGHGLRWVEDDSNQDLRFTRNQIRHRVLPALQAAVPGAEANLARAAAHFRESAALLAELAREDMARVAAGSPGARERLRGLSEARGRNVLCEALRAAGEQVPVRARMADLLAQLRGHAAVRLVQGAVALCAWRDRFWLEPAVPADYLPILWRGETALRWGQGRVCFAPATGPDALRLVVGEVMLSSRSDGARLRTRPGGPHRAFKQLCQEADIPPWTRTTLPVLSQGERVLWVGHLGSDADALCASGESGWRVRWDPHTPA